MNALNWRTSSVLAAATLAWLVLGIAAEPDSSDVFNSWWRFFFTVLCPWLAVLILALVVILGKEMQFTSVFLVGVGLGFLGGALLGLGERVTGDGRSGSDPFALVTNILMTAGFLGAVLGALCAPLVWVAKRNVGRLRRSLLQSDSTGDARGRSLTASRRRTAQIVGVFGILLLSFLWGFVVEVSQDTLESWPVILSVVAYVAPWAVTLIVAVTAIMAWKIELRVVLGAGIALGCVGAILALLGAFVPFALEVGERQLRSYGGDSSWEA